MAPDAVDRFLELWNAGAIQDLRPLMADGYSYGEPLYPGPYDADGHVQLMQEVLDRTPDRRFENVVRVPGGSGAIAVTADWIGTVGGAEMRLNGIFVFDVNAEATRIERMRAFYRT